MRQNVMSLIVTLVCVVTVTQVAGSIVKTDRDPIPASKFYTIPIENDVSFIRQGRFEGITYNFRSAQNPNTTAVLVDSSINGYGMIVSHISPVAFISGMGFVVGYRGWAGPDVNFSGIIRSTESPDGLNFFGPYNNLNNPIPGGIAPLKGRYPSAVGNSDYPFIIWTEATNFGSGDNNGGRPLYTYDEFGWLGGSYFSPAIDMNPSWSTVPPADGPGDLWVNCPIIVHDGTSSIILSTSSQWSPSPDASYPERSVYLLRSYSYLHGYAFFDQPVELFKSNDYEAPTETGSTTSSATIDINDSGIGYAMITASFNDTTIEKRHTFMIRKTTDYGATWSGEGGTGFNGTDYYFMPDSTMRRIMIDSGFLPDTILFYDETDTTQIDTAVSPGPFPTYDHEVHVDDAGNLHIFATFLVESNQEGSIWTGITGSGLYHLWCSDPSDPSTWNASQIADLSDTFIETELPGGIGGDNHFQVWGTAAKSNQSDATWWVNYFALADTSLTGWNWDVYLHKSEDGGATWSTPINITQTSGYQEDEVYAHLAPVATDTNCFMVYYQPEYSENYYNDPTEIAAFKQRLWFVTYGNPIALGVDQKISIPENLTLSQNYPNPFNPVTTISYALDIAGHTNLDIYDIRGAKVRSLIDEEKQAGIYQISFDASDLSSGIYFYKMTHNGISRTRKLVFMK